MPCLFPTARPTIACVHGACYLVILAVNFPILKLDQHEMLGELRERTASDVPGRKCGYSAYPTHKTEIATITVPSSHADRILEPHFATKNILHGRHRRSEIFLSYLTIKNKRRSVYIVVKKSDQTKDCYTERINRAYPS